MKKNGFIAVAASFLIVSAPFAEAHTGADGLVDLSNTIGEAVIIHLDHAALAAPDDRRRKILEMPPIEDIGLERADQFLIGPLELIHG